MFLRELIEEARKSVSPRRVWIYGSRARGDHHLLSDFDLAFDIPPEKGKHWASFSMDAQEHAKTLYQLDIVDVNQVDEVLRERILSEGVILYEQNVGQ